MRALHRMLDQFGLAVAALQRPGWRIRIDRPGKAPEYVTPGAYMKLSDRALAGTRVALSPPVEELYDDETGDR